MLLALVMLIGMVVIVVRSLARPVPPVPPETKRMEAFTRVPWSPKYIDVPIRSDPIDKK